MADARKVVRFLAGGRVSGGTAYEDLAAAALAPDFSVERPALPGSPTRRLLAMARMRGEASVWIRDYASTLTQPLDRTVGRNVAILHHIDNTVKPALRRAVSNVLDLGWRRAVRRMDAVVVVSTFWRDRLLALGCDDVVTIHNAFDPSEFHLSAEEVQSFTRRHGLAGRPIVYLGNCQRAKGVVEAQKALQGLDAHLVTSGPRKVDVATVNLDLSRRDYLCLLKASSVVVTMSLFDEGWCRTAHEAMLCGTPVVGSGRGGMAELLQGGRQVLCPDFHQLRNAVEEAMGDAKRGAAGQAFASREEFTLPHFSARWRSLVHGVATMPR